MTQPRILVAALYHETHSFVDETTGIAEYTIHRGPEILARRGDGSTLDGFLEVADREGWQVVPVSDFSALPSGTTDHAVFEQFWSELDQGIRSALAEGGLDGILLALHGAMVTTESVDPEGELLGRIRAIPGAGTLPVFGVFDLHATFTAAMAAGANGLVGYRENPHIDARDSAVRAADLLARTLKEGRAPHMIARNAPIVWPPTGTGTADRPMRDLEVMARQIEAENPDIWTVNVVAGYSFADVPDVGVAFSVTTVGNDADAVAALDRLEAKAIELQGLGLPQEWSLDDALEEAKRHSDGPSIIVEPSDNIGGGAPGDCTSVLRGFLKHGITNAAVAIADPAAVAALADVPVGGTTTLSIGGKGSRLDPGPVELEVTLIGRSDGVFTLEDRNSHLAAMQGVYINMGPSAVVEAQGIKILLNSIKTPPFDLGQLRSQGIIPEELSVIGVKAAVAHRRAYDKIAKRSFTVTTPGPCTSDIKALPYTRIRPGVFPLA